MVCEKRVIFFGDYSLIVCFFSGVHERYAVIRGLFFLFYGVHEVAALSFTASFAKASAAKDYLLVIHL